MIRNIKRVIWKAIASLKPQPKRMLAERYPQYDIGKGTYGDLEVRSWGEGATLRIGSYTSVAAGVKVFLGGEHRTDWISTYPFNALWISAKKYVGHPMSKGDVVIGSDVWIGCEALILSGVTIGDGAVIAARAVVSRNVPPYTIVAGNPAVPVKRRFDVGVSDRLIEVHWWDWSSSKIENAMADLLSSDVEKFLGRAERGEYD